MSKDAKQLEIANTRIVEVLPEVRVTANTAGQVMVKGNMPPVKCARMLIDALGALLREVDEQAEQKTPLVQVVGGGAIPKN